jgi:hypothetical protein
VCVCVCMHVSASLIVNNIYILHFLHHYEFPYSLSRFNLRGISREMHTTSTLLPQPPSAAAFHHGENFRARKKKAASALARDWSESIINIISLESLFHRNFLHRSKSTATVDWSENTFFGRAAAKAKKKCC